MQIQYSIREVDPIIGKGIITNQRIKKGDVVWISKRVSYDNSHIEMDYNVITYNEKNIEQYISNLSTIDSIKRFLDLSYGVADEIHYILDDGKYMNHSPNPNCITDMSDATTYALRDIEIGEMLSENYSTYSHPDYLINILKKYNCEPDYYTITQDHASSN
jgi:hypothetical protein